MNDWPTSWRELALDHIGIAITDHAMSVLRDWHLSTPTQPWTNNPLGLPALGNNVPEAMGTPYGAFPSHDEFRKALKRLVDSGGHMPVSHALQDGTSVARAWRTINGLNLPGSSTETDYPSVLLDRADGSYRSKLQATPKSERKSIGSGPRSMDLTHPVLQTARKIHDAAQRTQDLNTLIALLTQRVD